MDNLKKLLSCPYCDSDCVHIESVGVNRGGEVTMISKSGTTMKSMGVDGRGAAVEIKLWCESGHKWIRKLHFHKGSVEQSDSILIAGDPEYMNFVTDLWRD